ncbi:MAG: ATP-binding protein [Sphingomicrobium sp.]
MTPVPALALSILDAFAEPTLIVERGMVRAANAAMRALIGQQVTDRDVRIALRHPLALDTIAAGRAADVEVVGIGAADRPWHLQVRPLGGGSVLVRLSDRSELIAAERMRTDFVANASHELRTPLATIMGYAETLAEPGEIEIETRSRFGTIIEGEARRMLRIVEDLMSLSRIEADRFRAPDDRIDMGDVGRIAVDHAAALADRRGCRISAEIGGGLPEIRGDYGQLLQMADNLIGNALRYGCNAKSCTVNVIVRAENDRVILIVRDDGDGISPEHLPRLTERFYRIDSARSRESGGTGLGLAIVKHIVERHRGTLDIRSGPGRGTEVTVGLPAD